MVRKKVQQFAERQQGLFGIEQTQLHAVEPGKAINTKLPKIDRENVKQEKVPIMFENLETKKIGSLKKCVLDEANQLLCRFRMGEVEELMGIFRNVGGQ
ncbi:hypothetical protein RAB80_002203 [Fusarium oxysporum f. sp. vasinfectum]|nr:hypothetical protein RAB80_010204 [Fusarium oxysporum f. sp. vasinfectum]KAK2680410.1 hypothetical protein RAB80_002203 [Fusarium oxysporum f. sp. vasinfectum]KAK2922979.1 hypothetical protein FoTM2_017221 [Fusarium oxysporum f. sp. vasinfectum]